VQKWNAAANLFTATTIAAAADSPPALYSRKAFSFERGVCALRDAVPYPSNIPVEPRLTENYPAQSSFRAFANDKGATVLMLIYAPVWAAADPDRDRKLLEAVEIVPDALPALARERALNVRA
jgi:hypothetical protein